jgi:hypothetical protein
MERRGSFLSFGVLFGEEEECGGGEGEYASESMSSDPGGDLF